MKRDYSSKRTADLGAASRTTRGGPTGYIEVTGFLPKLGIDQE